MTKQLRILSVVVICALSMLSIAAVPADYGDNEGTIRGAAFEDLNRNGKMDEGEKGVGWVYFTVSNGDYSHTYHSEWQEKDSAGNEYATGYFGPVPLTAGWWTITFHVPEGYVATTPTQITVDVPGSEGGHVADAFIGLYPTGGKAVNVLPQTGIGLEPAVLAGLAFLGLGSIASIGRGLLSRKK